MKKKCLFYFSLFSLMSFSACQSSDELSSNEDSGKVLFYLSSDVTYPKAKVDDTPSTAPYEDIKNYTVELTNSKAEIILTQLYRDMPASMTVTPDNYSVRAFYGENVAVGYDKLYVEGKYTFTVNENSTEKVQFSCVPANAKIKVVYSEDFFTYYSDCTIGFKTQHISAPFLMARNDSDKALFLKSNKDEELNVTFDLKNIKGETVVPKGFGEQKLTINARDFLTITVKPKLIDIEGGKISGITVSVDTGVTDQTIDIILPDEFLPGEDTTVNN